MGFVIGIDGGGTKSIGYIADENGKILGKSKSGSLNFHSQGEKSVKDHLHELINSLTYMVGCSMKDVELISMGIAGIGRNKDRNTFLSIISSLNIESNLLLTTDIHIALVGAHGKEKGIFTLSGTGSISFAIDSYGRQYRVGGWGHIIGDEGSGYDIAKKGLALVAKTIDGIGENPSLMDRVFHRYGVKDTDEFIRYIYNPSRTKADIAKISEDVYHCALEGNNECLEILEKASKDLVDLTIALISKIPLEDEYIVSVGGGVFDNMDLVYKYFTNTLNEYKYNITVKRPMYSPVIGALILAFNNLNKKIDNKIWENY
ncbi:MAG: BadF/BadG/BcrA/BcrD ATPase family protein [Clostridiaceae bacterium]